MNDLDRLTTVTCEVSEKFTQIECPLLRQKLHSWVSGGYIDLDSMRARLLLYSRKVIACSLFPMFFPVTFALLDQRAGACLLFCRVFEWQAASFHPLVGMSPLPRLRGKRWKNKTFPIARVRRFPACLPPIVLSCEWQGSDGGLVCSRKPCKGLKALL